MDDDDLCRCGHHEEDHTSFGCGMVLSCRCKCFVLADTERNVIGERINTDER